MIKQFVISRDPVCVLRLIKWTSDMPYISGMVPLSLLRQVGMVRTLMRSGDVPYLLDQISRRLGCKFRLPTAFELWQTLGVTESVPHKGRRIALYFKRVFSPEDLSVHITDISQTHTEFCTIRGHRARWVVSNQKTYVAAEQDAPYENSVLSCFRLVCCEEDNAHDISGEECDT